MLLVLPILIPLVAATVSIAIWHRGVQRWLGLTGAVGLLIAAGSILVRVRRNGIQILNIGAWEAPFGITLVADHFSALMVVLGGIISVAISVYSLVNIDTPRQSFAYFPLLHLLMVGVSAAFLTGDVFNLFVWFEVLLISSFVLLALGSQHAQLEGALKYVTINLVSSFLLLIAIGLLYGAVGTLNMAHVAQRLSELDRPTLKTALSALFFVALGIKSALFPLFFWLPASYHTPPAAVSALFAGLLTKVGVYALIRFFTLLFTHQVDLTHTLILIISGLTMLTGVLGAVAQHELRRILSFHIISQIGYMTLGLGLFTPLAIAGSVFYIAHHIIVKTNLFLVSGIVYALGGSFDLDRLGGLYRRSPLLCLGFAIPALSLAGIPPLSGFVAKLILVRAGLEIGQYLVVGVAIAVSLLTLYSMSKIWNAAFWAPSARGWLPVEDAEEQTDPRDVSAGGQSRLSRRDWWLLGLPVGLLALLTVLIGFVPGPLFAISEAAAAELLDPRQYIEAVLGEPS